MALNPNTIKALFGKLAPMADDVAGAVANYGDDAARLIGEYGDDVAADTSRLLKKYTYGNEGNPVLNTGLQKRLVYDNGIPVLAEPSGGVLSKAYDYAFKNAGPKGFKDVTHAMNSAVAPTYSFGEMVDALGPHGTYDTYFAEHIGSPHVGAVPLSTNMRLSDLVHEGDGYVRPHKNTALGRWFEKARSTPSKTIQYDYRIGPEKQPFEFKGYVDELPF